MKSRSSDIKMIIMRSLILSWICEQSVGLLFGTSSPSIFSKSYLFSPVIFLLVSSSSSISCSLSMDLLLISVRILLAIFTCMSIFFLRSVIYGSLSMARVRLLLKSVLAEAALGPPIFSYSFVQATSVLSTLGPASWKPVNEFLLRISSSSLPKSSSNVSYLLFSL